MRKSFIALASVAALAVATLAAPQPAKADIASWWLVPAVLGGMWVGGQILATPSYGRPYGYYQQQYYQAAPQGAPRNCWTEQRNIDGQPRTVQVCY
ncbi:MAG: hypothetical protein WD207_09785 [Xanthobacteraceae bacterium]